MDRAQLIEHVVSVTGYSQPLVADTLDHFVLAAAAALVHGHDVVLPGFGVLSLKRRDGSVSGRSTKRTHETISFRAFKSLRSLVAAGRAPGGVAVRWTQIDVIFQPDNWLSQATSRKRAAYRAVSYAALMKGPPGSGNPRVMSVGVMNKRKLMAGARQGGPGTVSAGAPSLGKQR